MLQKHLDDMFSKEFDPYPRYFTQISAIFTGSLASRDPAWTISEVHSEIGRFRVIGCCGWKEKRDDGIVNETTIIFVYGSLKSVGNLKYHRGLHLSATDFAWARPYRVKKRMHPVHPDLKFLMH